MNILMILNSGFPGDIRVEKECKALLNVGHNILVTSVGEGPDSFNEMKVARLDKDVSKPFRRFSQRLLKNFPLYKRSLLKAIGDFQPEVVHVHDLEWASLGSYLAKRFEAKLVLDFHENFPAALEAWSFSDGSLPRKIAYLMSAGKKSWKKFEMKMVKKADFVIVVVPEAIERFRGNNAFPSRFAVVSNTEDPVDWVNDSVNTSEDKFVISYVGRGGIHRGIDTLIQSFRYVKNKDIELRIVGIRKMTPYGRYIDNLIVKFGLENRVSMKDGVSSTEVGNEIAASNLCAIPHNRMEHTETTIPHKLFQCMAMSKPVLVSDVGPLRRVVERANCGYIFRANDPIDCANSINVARGSKASSVLLGINGRNAVEGFYNWNHDAKRLKRVYSELSRE